MDPKLELDDFVSPKHPIDPHYRRITQEEIIQMMEILRKQREGGEKEGGEEAPDLPHSVPERPSGQVVRPNRRSEMDKLIGMLADALGLARRIRDHMEQDQRNNSIRQLHDRAREEERHMLHEMITEYKQRVAQMEEERHLLHDTVADYQQQLAQKEQEIRDLRKRLEDLQI